MGVDKEGPGNERADWKAPAKNPEQTSEIHYQQLAQMLLENRISVTDIGLVHDALQSEILQKRASGRDNQKAIEELESLRGKFDKIYEAAEKLSAPSE